MTQLDFNNCYIGVRNNLLRQTPLAGIDLKLAARHTNVYITEVHLRPLQEECTGLGFFFFFFFFFFSGLSPSCVSLTRGRGAVYPCQ